MMKKENTTKVARNSTDHLMTKGDVQVPSACSPTLIGALLDLHQKRMHEKEINMWISNLERLFFQTDKDMSGGIDQEELKEMIAALDVSDSVKSTLYENFSEIDKDNIGCVNLRDFITFFLLNSMFIEEVLSHAGNNAPWQYESGLSNRQKWRLRIYKITEYPGYNTVSKVMFCVDLILACVPVIMLCLEGLRPSFKQVWDEQKYMWVVSIFFAFQYICGILTCKSKRCFVSGAWHIIDLVSFIFWILSKVFGSTKLWNPAGFIVFRTLRVWKLHTVFDLKTMREEFELYTQTMNIFWTSYRSVIGFLVWTIMFFSVLIYVFERGEYDQENAIWTRDEDKGFSPFSNMYNCIYFNIATMTTLGFGNHYPESYIGKMTALMTSCLGIVNLTLLINIIGGCFEETFRKFIEEKSKRLDGNTALYIEKYIVQACENFTIRQAVYLGLNDPGTGRSGCLENIRTLKPEASQISQSVQFDQMKELKESSPEKHVETFGYPVSRYLQVI